MGRREEIRARLTAASAGPWSVSVLRKRERAYDTVVGADGSEVALTRCDADGLTGSNAEMVASAHDDLSWLLGLADRLDARVRSLEAERDTWRRSAVGERSMVKRLERTIHGITGAQS